MSRPHTPSPHTRAPAQSLKVAQVLPSVPSPAGGSGGSPCGPAGPAGPVSPSAPAGPAGPVQPAINNTLHTIAASSTAIITIDFFIVYIISETGAGVYTVYTIQRRGGSVWLLAPHPRRIMLCSDGIDEAGREGALQPPRACVRRLWCRCYGSALAVSIARGDHPRARRPVLGLLATPIATAYATGASAITNT